MAAAGGISALARAVGVAQPSVSNWRRVPAERVLAVEAVTAVPRQVLRPDLYPETVAADRIDDIDEARGKINLVLLDGSLSFHNQAKATTYIADAKKLAQRAVKAR